MGLTVQHIRQTALPVWFVFYCLLCVSLTVHSTEAKHKQDKTTTKPGKAQNAKKSVSSNEQAEAAKGNLQQIQEKIQALSTEISASRVAKQDAHTALKASETAISASRKQLREIQEAQQQNLLQLESLQRQETQLQHQVHMQQSSLSQQLNQQYRHGNRSPLQMWLQQQDPASTARNLKYLAYLTAAHQQQISSLQDNQAEVERVRDETALRMQETEQLAKKHAEATKKLEHEKMQRAQALVQISKQIETQEQQLSRLKHDEEALSELIQKLILEAKKRQQEEDARNRREKQQQAQNKPKPGSGANDPSVRKNGRVFEHAAETRVDGGETTQTTVIAKNESLPEQGNSGETFAQLRGQLRLPVRGDVINRFGAARADTGVSWKGLFIRANEGSEVKSVAGGQVVFADWMRGFGNLIVIDHGSGYMSLYGNNEALYKSTGQRVRAGDTIATVGNSGGNANSGVYYELRRNSVPFDPLQWSALR